MLYGVGESGDPYRIPVSMFLVADISHVFNFDLEGSLGEE